jgi:hypothetical protein
MSPILLRCTSTSNGSIFAALMGVAIGAILALSI